MLKLCGEWPLVSPNLRRVSTLCLLLSVQVKVNCEHQNSSGFPPPSEVVSKSLLCHFTNQEHKVSHHECFVPHATHRPSTFLQKQQQQECMNVIQFMYLHFHFAFCSLFNSRCYLHLEKADSVSDTKVYSAYSHPILFFFSFVINIRFLILLPACLGQAKGKNGVEWTTEEPETRKKAKFC